MGKKLYEVHRKCNILGYNRVYYIMANDEIDALKIAFPNDSTDRYYKYYRYRVYPV